MGCTNSTFCPSPPLTPKQKLRVLSLAVDAATRRNGELCRRVLWLVEFNAAPNPKPVRGVRTTDHHVDPSRGLWCRFYLPAEPVAEPLPVIIFFHGGGFALLSAATREFDSFCRRLCRQMSVAVVSVNYRLSPENRFPAQYDDGLDVIRFLDSAKATGSPVQNPLLQEFLNSADLSICFLVGDSAGANIAHNVARRWVEGEHAHVKLAGLIGLQPFFGGERRVPSELRITAHSIVGVKRTDWLWKAFLPEGATRDHSAANPVASAKELSEGFPPVMIMGGDLDPLLDWQRIYYESLLKNGKEAEFVVYPGAFHGSYIFPKLPGSSEVICDVKSFVNRQICRNRQGILALKRA